MSEQDIEAPPPAVRSFARSPYVLLMPMSLCFATAGVLDQFHGPAWLTYGFLGVDAVLTTSFFIWMKRVQKQPGSRYK